MSTSDEYRGSRIVIRNNVSRCIHSRYCVLGRPDVFVPNVDGPWIQPDAAAADTVAAQIALCPSGALLYERIDGGVQEKPPGVNTVRVWENGPLVFNAALDVAGETTSFRATLCRCGHSRNKPYCDRSHVEAKFISTGEPATKPSQPLARRDGPLTVTPNENGPPGGRRLARNLQRERPHRLARQSDGALPLRRICEQAFLRRHPQEDRLCRAGRLPLKKPAKPGHSALEFQSSQGGGLIRQFEPILFTT